MDGNNISNSSPFSFLCCTFSTPGDVAVCTGLGTSHAEDQVCIFFLPPKLGYMVSWLTAQSFHLQFLTLSIKDIFTCSTLI